MNSVGVVIVTHNSEKAIGACLDSLDATGTQVVVVDNASQDRTCEQVLRRPGVTLIANPWNRGFAAAVNQGIDALDCRYVLLLNPDAELAGGLEALSEACSQPGVAAAGGKLVDQRNRPQVGFMVRRLPRPWALIMELLGLNRLWPRNPINRRYRCLDLPVDAPAEVEQPAGAFLMVRRDVWRKLGGFDESFHPLWFEDVDFCKRAGDEGYRIGYVPSAVAKHQGGHSVKQLDWEARQLYWCGNLLGYAAKHFRPWAFSAVCVAVVLGSFLRTILGIIRWRSLKPISICGRVIRLAGQFLRSGWSEPPRISSAFVGR